MDGHTNSKTNKSTDRQTNKFYTNGKTAKWLADRLREPKATITK